MKGVRANLLKCSAEGFARLAPFPLGENVPWAEGGFYTGKNAPERIPNILRGYTTVRSPLRCALRPFSTCSPKSASSIFAPRPGQDDAARRRDGGEGVLIANEYVSGRAKILSQNVERMGVKNCAVVSASAEELAETLPAFSIKCWWTRPARARGCSAKTKKPFGNGARKMLPAALPASGISWTRRRASCGRADGSCIRPAPSRAGRTRGRRKTSLPAIPSLRCWSSTASCRTR